MKPNLEDENRPAPPEQGKAEDPPPIDHASVPPLTDPDDTEGG